MSKRKEPCPHGVLRGRCRECYRLANQARRAANPEAHRARARTYYAANATRIKAYVKEWASANPEKTSRYGRTWYAANRDKHSVSVRGAAFTRKYGITYAEAVAMRQAQGNQCALCMGAMSDATGSVTRWVVDHYDTPAGPVVRGILHQGCNLALGLMNDHDPQALRRAAEYLERHGRAAPKSVADDQKDASNPQLRLIP